MSILFSALVFGGTAGRAVDVVWSTNAHGVNAVTCVTFAGNSVSLASASLDHTAQVWAVSNVVRLRLLGSLTTMHAVALSSDGALVVTGDSDGQIRMWRMSDGGRVWGNATSPTTIKGVAFSPDDSRVADAREIDANKGHLYIHRTSDGQGTVFEQRSAPFYAVRFSPGGDLLASASADQTVVLWRVSDGAIVRSLSAHSNAVYSVDFSPDGTLLATASEDGTARLWKVNDGTVARVIEGGGGKAARFSADGKLLLTVNTGTIKVWRVADGMLLQTYADTGAEVLAVAPNGQYFAYGTSSGAVVLARMPVVLNLPGRTNEQLRLEWQGGTGLYQLQQTSNVVSPVWENVGGITTNLATNVPLTATNTFVRIQSLTNPP